MLTARVFALWVPEAVPLCIMLTTCVFRALQVREAVSTILDTMPKGGGGGGGLSREEIVDRICEDLLSKVSSRR